MVREYIPERGDVVSVELSPQAREGERRQAVVVSPSVYNGKMGLVLVCPITPQARGGPFEVPVPDGLPVSGVILSDQMRSLDWRVREAELICRLPALTLREVLQRLGLLVQA